MAMTKIEIALNLLNIATSEQLPKIIGQIDTVLSEITHENFSKYGKQLVDYGNILFAKAYDTEGKIKDGEYESKLNRFYKRLREIDKLNINRDIPSIMKIWNQIMSAIRSGQAHLIDDNTKKGSFIYFYFIVHVNKLLADTTFSCNTLIAWLILRNRIDWIEEKNFDRVILVAIRSLVKEENVQSLINYFDSANRKDVLEGIMRHALLIGRCKTVKSLLDKKIQLPNKIEDVLLTLQLAISNNMQELTQKIDEKFTVHEILNYYLLKGEYKLAFNFFKFLSPKNIP